MHELSYIDIISKDITQKLLTIYNIYLQYIRSSFIKMQVSFPSDFKPALEVNHLATKTLAGWCIFNPDIEAKSRILIGPSVTHTQTIYPTHFVGMWSP